MGSGLTSIRSLLQRRSNSRGQPSKPSDNRRRHSCHPAAEGVPAGTASEADLGEDRSTGPEEDHIVPEGGRTGLEEDRRTRGVYKLVQVDLALDAQACLFVCWSSHLRQKDLSPAAQQQGFVLKRAKAKSDGDVAKATREKHLQVEDAGDSLPGGSNPGLTFFLTMIYR